MDDIAREGKQIGIQSTLDYKILAAFLSGMSGHHQCANGSYNCKPGSDKHPFPRTTDSGLLSSNPSISVSGRHAVAQR